MQDVMSSDKIMTREAKIARNAGYGVHHDMLGWYIIALWREREPASGYSLGFDGRRHFRFAADAWEEAAKRAERRAKTWRRPSLLRQA